MDNIIKEIETKYPVDRILVNGEQVWPYLRISYYYGYETKQAYEKGEKHLDQNITLVQKVRRLVNVFYGLGNWLGNYDFIVLSNTSERKQINGKYFNKLLDPIIDELGKERVLYIETPVPSLYPVKTVYTKNIVCSDFLEIMAVILQTLLPIKHRIRNADVLQSINRQYSFEINGLEVVKHFNAKRLAFSLLFRKIKPKALLLSDYSAYLPAIKAAKNAGIKVIEFQHGLIGDEHPGYNLYVELDKTYFPDYLLTFGKRELKTFDNSRFLESRNVYPVGSFYIEHIGRNHKPSEKLVTLLKNYRKIIGVTLEWTIEKRVIEFVCETAALDKKICYLLIPRRPQEEHYAALELPDNVILIRDENFYELMTYVDFHSTVYSTCALESPSLGVQNILINIDDLARRYYGALLNDDRVTRYADTPADFIRIVNTFQKLDRCSISRLNEELIVTGYMRNLRDFIAGHLQ